MGLAKWADRRGKLSTRTVAQAVELLRAHPGGLWVGVPFRFLDREKIYAEMRAAFGDGFHGVINDCIDTAPVVDVPIVGLRAIQHTIDRDRVEQYIRTPKLIRRGTRSPTHGGLVDLPIVVVWHGEDALYDGHHRATAEFYRGARTFEARKADLDAVLRRRSAASSRG